MILISQYKIYRELKYRLWVRSLHSQLSVTLNYDSDQVRNRMPLTKTINGSN